MSGPPPLAPKARFAGFAPFDPSDAWLLQSVLYAGGLTEGAELRDVIGLGDGIGDALRRSTTPPSLNLGGVIEQLADADQRDAVRSLQRLQWAKAAGSGQHAQVRALLRSAFQRGPQWRAAPVAAANSALPPLYPDRAA